MGSIMSGVLTDGHSEMIERNRASDTVNISGRNNLGTSSMTGSDDLVHR